jgi:hypothetical protein
LGWIFNMATGEDLSSKNQREIALAQIADERERVSRPVWWIVWPFLMRRSEASNRNLKRLIEAHRIESGSSIDPT